MELARQIAGITAITALLLLIVDWFLPQVHFDPNKLLIALVVGAIVFFAITVVQRNPRI